MTSIKTYCTIVNMKMDTGSWASIPPVDDALPGLGQRSPSYWRVSGKVTVDSGWDDASVMSNLNEANKIWSVADVEFVFAGLKTIELEGYQKDGRVDRKTLDLIAATVGARSFIRGEVKVAFIKGFTGTYRGRSMQELCFASVYKPYSLEQGAWVLAHELGHLLGLGHDCSDSGRMMHYAWMYGSGHRISEPELAIVKAHAHVDRSAKFIAPTEDEPVCRA